MDKPNDPQDSLCKHPKTRQQIRRKIVGKSAIYKIAAVIGEKGGREYDIKYEILSLRKPGRRKEVFWMYEQILNGIAARLKELFGGEIMVYTDSKVKEPHFPCFFVELVEHTEKPLIGQRYYRKTDVAIRYMTETEENGSGELNAVADFLMDGMEYINLSDGSLLRGTGKRAKPDYSQKMLTFLLSYSMFVTKAIQTEETMKEMNTDLKKG